MLNFICALNHISQLDGDFTDSKKIDIVKLLAKWHCDKYVRRSVGKVLLLVFDLNVFCCDVYRIRVMSNAALQIIKLQQFDASIARHFASLSSETG